MLQKITNALAEPFQSSFTLKVYAPHKEYLLKWSNSSLTEEVSMKVNTSR